MEPPRRLMYIMALKRNTMLILVLAMCVLIQDVLLVEAGGQGGHGGRGGGTSGGDRSW